MTPHRGDVVEVEWLDSEHIAIGWALPAKYRVAVQAPQSYRTAGYWIDKAGEHVLIALNIDPSNRTIGYCMSIPRVAVTKITVLGRASKQVRKALR